MSPQALISHSEHPDTRNRAARQSEDRLPISSAWLGKVKWNVSELKQLLRDYQTWEMLQVFFQKTSEKNLILCSLPLFSDGTTVVHSNVRDKNLNLEFAW